MHFLRALLPFDTPTSRPGGHDAPLVLKDRHGRQLVRRHDVRTQPLRRGVQLAFAALNVWIGVEFYRWVRFYETSGATVRVDRPAGVEGWLPIAALMNLKYWVTTWEVPDLHAAGLFLLVAFLTMSWLLRKAFCSWLCPIGTLSEYLWEGGQALFGRSFRPWRWLDIPLRSLKYILFGLFAYAVLSMSAESIVAFLRSPYGYVADVKMLDFFRHMGRTSAIVIGVLVLSSLVVQNAWCRYLCPYGAMLGLVALVSPTRIRRDAEACIDCAKCSKACPAGLPVDRLASVRSAECTNCLLCITACPSEAALSCSLARRRTLSGPMVAAGVVTIFVVVVGVAKVTGHWDTFVPDNLLFQLIPNAHRYGHP
jgi:polyferredoxin